MRGRRADAPTVDHRPVRSIEHECPEPEHHRTDEPGLERPKTGFPIQRQEITVEWQSAVATKEPTRLRMSTYAAATASRCRTMTSVRYGKYERSSTNSKVAR